jgi:hypothetical protein
MLPQSDSVANIRLEIKLKLYHILLLRIIKQAWSFTCCPQKYEQVFTHPSLNGMCRYILGFLRHHRLFISLT